MKTIGAYILGMIPVMAAAITSPDPALTIELLIFCMLGSAISGGWSLLTSRNNGEAGADLAIYVIISLVAGMSFGYAGTMLLYKLDVGWVKAIMVYPPFIGLILAISGYSLAIVFLKGLLARQLKKRLNDTQEIETIKRKAG